MQVDLVSLLAATLDFADCINAGDAKLPHWNRFGSNLDNLGFDQKQATRGCLRHGHFRVRRDSHFLALHHWSIQLDGLIIAAADRSVEHNGCVRNINLDFYSSSWF